MAGTTRMDALAKFARIESHSVTDCDALTENIRSHDSARERFETLCSAPGNAPRWDWYALMRLIQAANPEFPKIGYGVLLRDDPVRFGQPPFLHPPPATIAGLYPDGVSSRGQQRSPGSAKPLITSYHFGLFGPRGPLPLHLTEYAHIRVRTGDSGFASFCNVLHHRFLSFFFRAWADARKEIDLDRGQGSISAPGNVSDISAPDRVWEAMIGSLLGIGLESLRDADSIPSYAKLYYAGRLIQGTRNADGLEAILADYFEVPAKVMDFTRKDVRVPVEARWSLGGRNGYLGLSTIAGEFTEDYQSGVRIRMGPLSRVEFEMLLPESLGFAQLHDWVRFYVGRESDPNPERGLESAWDLQLVLRGPEVFGEQAHQKLRAGKSASSFRLGDSLRLGWTTWLYSSPPAHDLRDLLLAPLVDSARAK